MVDVVAKRGAFVVLLAGMAHAATGLGTIEVGLLETSPGEWASAHLAEVAGDTAVVGAPWEGGTGSAYVFVKAAGEWTEQAVLAASSPVNGSFFGSAVTLDGNWIAVGQPGQSPGVVYVFERSGTTWSEQAALTANDGGEAFGASVAMRGTTLMVGDTAGAVYVLERSGSSWDEAQKIEPAVPSAAFGSAIGWDGGSTLLIGAQHDSLVDVLAGSATFFTFDGTSWTEQQKFLPDAPAGFDRFGLDVALDGDTALVGSFYDDDSGQNAGAVYVYGRTGTVWSRTDKLVPAGPLVTPRHFGFGVDLEGDRAVATSGIAGEIVVYERSGSVWSEELYLAGNAVAVALDGDTVIGHGKVNGKYYAFELADTPNTFCAAADITCPCGNDGSPGRGCDNQQLTGGVQALLSAFDGPGTSAEITCFGFPPMASPAAVLIRSSSLLGSSTAFGDGARCVAAPVVRLGAALAEEGHSVHSFGHGAGPGTYHYQGWYRSNPPGFCMPEAYNASSGVTIVWP